MIQYNLIFNENDTIIFYLIQLTRTRYYLFISTTTYYKVVGRNTVTYQLVSTNQRR